MRKNSPTNKAVRVPRTTSFLLAFVILAGAGVVKWYSALMPLDTYVPSPQLPSPNARDSINKAEAMLVGPIDWTAPPGADSAQLKGPYAGYQTLSLAREDSLIAQNQLAFTQLESALNYPYRARSFVHEFPYYAPDRAMSRALRSAGEDRAAHGDWGSAMNYYFDAIRLGADLPQGSSIGLLMGIACEAIGRRDAYTAIDRLSSVQAKLDARRLEAIDSARQPYYQTLEKEKWAVQGSLLKTFADGNWRNTFFELGNNEEMAPSNLLDNIQFHCDSPRLIYGNYTRYMDEEVDDARLPWPQQLTTPQPVTPADPVNRVLLPVYQETAYRFYDTVALDRLLEVHLALQAYKLDHGFYPKTLSALTPDYLTSVPLDPFSGSRALAYKFAGDRFLLYSIGPDSVDNGGRPMIDSADKARLYQILGNDTSGDIVEGVNR